MEFASSRAEFASSRADRQPFVREYRGLARKHGNAKRGLSATAPVDVQVAGYLILCRRVVK